MRALKIASGKQGHGEKRSRFRQLWDQAEAYSAETDLLESDLDRLAVRVEAQIVPLERELGALIRQVLVRQLDFSDRKSLRNWQRLELERRVSVLVCDLVQMGMLDAALHERLCLRLAATLGITLEEQSELSVAEQLDLYPDREITASGTCSEDGFDGLREEESLIGSVLSGDIEAPATWERLDDSVFKRLFRQAAAALHPDKETDSRKVAEKHELMKQLLKAREERDLFTVLSLHERYAAADSALSYVDEQQLEHVLLAHLDNLHCHREQVVCKTPAHYIAFHRFHDRRPAMVEQLISEYLVSCELRKIPLDRFVSEIRTLKDYQCMLKEYVHRGGNR